MKIYREVLREGEELLAQAGIPEAKADAWWLFSSAFSMDRAAYLLHSFDVSDGEGYRTYTGLLQRRANRIPLQYILGSQEFCGYDFQVNESVLIPRQDTEVLVEQAVCIIGKKRPYKVLDMCTGSGCIGISVGKMCPWVWVDAVDISEEALEVAIGNKEKNRADNVMFQRSDLFENISGTYDMILSNPPYIESAAIPSLMPEVRDYEPKLALDGAEDGLKFYRSITKQSADYLKQGGYLLYEIGCNQAEAVCELMKGAGYTEIRVIKDMAHLDRVVIGKIEK